MQIKNNVSDGTHCITTLDHNNNIITDPTTKTENFANYFDEKLNSNFQNEEEINMIMSVQSKILVDEEETEINSLFTM